MEEMERIHLAASAIRKACGEAEIGIILGSGLGEYVNTLEGSRQISYADIPEFPMSTVPGHAGIWHAGELHGKRVAMMQGRFHYYEGLPLASIVRPVRVMRELGVKVLILTNAAGGVNLSYAPGDLMLISDFINLSGINPLIGPNLDELGVRFPDMTHPFDDELRSLAKSCGERLGVKLQEGVYAQMSGPYFETPAEIRMLRVLGADAVGMSTVPETIAARHCGIRVLGISCITNMAAGILDQPLTHEEVGETAGRVKETFKSVLDAIAAGISL